TELILRSAVLRTALLPKLGIVLERCGALLRGDPSQVATVERLAANAHANGVAVEARGPGELFVPGESITDPVAFTEALADRARARGADVRLGAPVAAIGRGENGGVRVELASGERLLVRGVANCAGLYADELAASAGPAPFEVYPRKGEFLVFEQPAEPLREILLPLPSAAGKGVLVFPTIDGHVIAGPTARDRADKGDWRVEPDAGELILEKARRMFAALEGAEPIAAYAGLRPAGRGANYAIAPSTVLPALVNVGAIRSTGLTAALGIGELVARLLGGVAGLRLRETPRETALPARTPAPPWWQLAAERSRRAEEEGA
ncbi:MAG: putative dehydrogenase, partial [Solirubrobacterales bacterium]|nr:putative dehydrogenase [Solirubrobacterales bacterium]